MPVAPLKVFISYSHDSKSHADRVLDLADRLREDGIDAEIDQYEDSPPEGWPTWCERQIKSASFVLLVCTEIYLRRVDGEEAPSVGHGVLWEARIIRQLLYDAGSVSTKFVPVLFSDGLPDNIPTPVKGAARFVVDDADGYERLFRLLTVQPRVLKPALGKLKTLPPKERKSSGLASAASTMHATAGGARTTTQTLSPQPHPDIHPPKRLPLSPSRAFVISPFGTKPGRDGRTIDFDAVFMELVQPALLDAGLEAFRADVEQQAGNIHADMFQELLLADLVVAELSIDNPNAWYELGVRHALRARGVILLFSGRDYLPFDVGPERALRYALKDGKPDPGHLKDDRKRLSSMAQATLGAWRGRRISPVYHLLPNLKEPDWRTLRLGDVNEYWEKLEEWQRRVAIAVKNNRPGDVLVLAEEPPTRVLQCDALRIAGVALVRLGHYRFALEVLERALQQNPDDLVCRQQKGIVLGRLGRHAEAQAWLESVKRDYPFDGETLALLGRTQKDEWLAAWRGGSSAGEMREAANDEAALLLEAARAYAAAFRRQPLNFYAGINAVMLGTLWRDLTGRDDPELSVEAMAHGVRWAVECALAADGRDYWARATLAELILLTADTDTVRQAYQEAAAVAGDWFALDSSKYQLCFMRDLGFRLDRVQAGIDVLTRRQERLQRQTGGEPRQVILFSGHMVDGPDRKEPRFPESKTEAARQCIRDILEKRGPGPEDLAISGAACGGDLLFAQACLERGLRVELRVPMLENEFLDASVNFAGAHWSDLYERVKAHPNSKILVLPQELGPTRPGVNSFERNNLWMLYAALAHGAPKVTGVLLWDRKVADGPGGTQHMHDLIARLTGRKPIVIDPATL